MKEYHKIQTVFKRDPENRFKTLLEGDYSMPEFEYLKDNLWVLTEKVDGTNIRIMYKDGTITFGGKTDRAQIPATLVAKLNDLFLRQIETFHDIFSGDVCLYGEGYGAKIQSGGKYKQQQDFVLFDVKVGDWWLQRENIEDIGAKLKLEVVPILGESTLVDMVNIVRRGFKSEWGDFIAEGVVARPKIELVARNGHRIISKLKYKDFNAKVLKEKK